jgi:heptosyltransferase-2
MLLGSSTKELVEGFSGLDEIVAYDQRGEQRGFWSMLAQIRARRFDLVVVSHPTLRLAMLMFLARVPTRIGSGYRWYSFLFNRRVFEHRKTAEKHEAEYNISLLKQLGWSSQEVPRVSLSIPETARLTAMTALRDLGISDSERFVVLHPGSGGSARDWRVERFGELAKRLSENGTKVVVTGARSEGGLVEEVVQRSGGAARGVVGRFSLKELAAFLGFAAVFVSNSTGPLHIAAAMGTCVIAFYPPIRECSPLRWGPLTDSKVIFEANSVLCPRCQGGPCQGDDCMDQITVGDVYAAVQKLLASDWIQS